MNVSSPIQAVKEAVSIRDALDYLGLPAPRGRAIRCPLPEHDDRHPSASIYGERDGESPRWWCHTCARGGDVLDLVEAVRGGDRRGAIAFLADRAGLYVGLRDGSPPRGRPAPARAGGDLRRRLRRALSDALDGCVLRPLPTETTLPVYDYVYGEMDRMRAAWGDREADDLTRLRELRDWWLWANRILRAYGIAVEEPETVGDLQARAARLIEQTDRLIELFVRRRSRASRVPNDAEPAGARGGRCQWIARARRPG